LKGDASGLVTKNAPMAGTSLLALIDDVAAILDDVAILTATAGKAPSLGGILVLAAPPIFEAAVGMLTGAATLGIMTLVQ
jgi:predicted DNA repair protein MutK